jgi:hypothetical protein
LIKPALTEALLFSSLQISGTGPMRFVGLTCLFLTLALPVAAHADDLGRWHSDKAHGYERYWTQSRSGARFTIWCPPSHRVQDALIGIDIKGRRPEPDTLVRIELDHKLITFRAGPDGYIRNDCTACTDNLTYFWHRLRSSVKFAVQFEDRRYAGFSLRGIRDVTPHTVCASQIAQNVE